MLGKWGEKPIIDAACSKEFFKPLNDGDLPTTTISFALNVVATEVAILAADWPTKYTIPAAISSLDISESI